MFQKTPLEGLLIYTPKVHHDSRGYFLESFNQKHFLDLDLPCQFIQDNCSLSTQGVVRGLHLQKHPHAQTKLIGVLQGRIFDVAVDLRPSSQTFGKWFGITLSDTDHKYLYIPKGFAHGFMTLSQTARVSYKVDSPYNKAAEMGLRYDDPTLNIEWPTTGQPLIISDKDKELPLLKDCQSEFR